MNEHDHAIDDSIELAQIQSSDEIEIGMEVYKKIPIWATSFSGIPSLDFNLLYLRETHRALFIKIKNINYHQYKVVRKEGNLVTLVYDDRVGISQTVHKPISVLFKEIIGLNIENEMENIIM